MTECMATYGLIAGLMVTVAQAVMNSLSSADAHEYRNTDFLVETYDDFILWGPLGFAFLSAAMLCVVVHYLATSCSDLDNMCPQVYAGWWMIARGNIVVTFVLTVLGLTGVMISGMKLYILQHATSAEDVQRMKTVTSGHLCGGVMGGAGVTLPWLLYSLGLAFAKNLQMIVTDIPLEVDFVYEQLDLYRQSCLDANFFLMDGDEFLKRIDATVGPYQKVSPMSREFAVLVFNTYKESEMTRHLRTCAKE